MENCTEKVWSDDTGDGYPGWVVCGGSIEPVGNTGIAQCDSCKTVYQFDHPS